MHYLWLVTFHVNIAPTLRLLGQDYENYLFLFSTGGVFLDKFNCRLVLAFILLGMGVMASVIPLASNFTELLVISVILGVFAGALDCGRYWSTVQR